MTKTKVTLLLLLPLWFVLCCLAGWVLGDILLLRTLGWEQEGAGLVGVFFAIGMFAIPLYLVLEMEA